LEILKGRHLGLGGKTDLKGTGYKCVDWIHMARIETIKGFHKIQGISLLA
jgi:hypothetical protein